MADSTGAELGVDAGFSDSAVRNGCGDGEAFFFRCGDGDSSSPIRVFFFFGDAVATGVGDSIGRGSPDFLGVGVGIIDFFFAELLFFFRGFGVGVGVAKIFLIASPNDSSAAVVSSG